MGKHDAGKNRENILFAVIGMTPSVLTETIWALACGQQSVLPDRVVVLTTTLGRQAINRQLFTKGTNRLCGWDRLVSALSRRGLDARDRLRFGMASDHIRLFPNPSGREDLADICTSEENAAAADFIMHELRAFTENPSVAVLASIAGGRKTMSALLMSCMSLLGRAQDRVLHVLVNPPFDTALEPPFIFPEKGLTHESRTGKKVRSASARIELIDVPFVRMRGWYEGAFKSTPPGYASLVTGVQRQAPAPQNYPLLTFDNSSGVLRVAGGSDVALSPTEFAALALLSAGFAEHDRLAERLAMLGALPVTASTPDWVQRFQDGGRFSDNDLLVESLRKTLSSARGKLAAHPLLAPLTEALVPKRGKPHRYPSAKIDFIGPDVFADIRG